jgi:hypothetical protein
MMKPGVTGVAKDVAKTANANGSLHLRIRLQEVAGTAEKTAGDLVQR